MRQRIRGAKDSKQEQAARIAINYHKERYSQGRRITHTVKLDNRHYQIEVISRKTVITATVISGYRPLTRLCTH